MISISMYFMLILSLISVWKCKAYLNQQSMKREMCRNFKPEKDGSGDGESEQKQTGFWSGLKRFLPFTSRATLKETYQLPLPDPGMRYHVRLLKPDESLRRHTITRILRFFPDIQWQTAEVLVDIALKKGVSLIRVTNDKDDAINLVRMLQLANPPVTASVYDSKSEETIV